MTLATRRLRSAAGLTALMTACIAAPGVQAQVMADVIGATVGNAVAAQQAYEAEQACLAGKPVEEKVRIKAEAATDATMTGYFRHAAASEQKELRKLFLVRAKDVRWSTREGLGEIGALQDPYATLVAPAAAEAATSPAATPSRLALVVAGDGKTARGVWRVDAPNAGPVAYCGVDFKPKGKAWVIWHMSLFKAPEAPPLPEAYCHFDSATAF